MTLLRSLATTTMRAVMLTVGVVLLGEATTAGVAAAEFNPGDYFRSNFPGFRFTLWDSLPSLMQGYAQAAGYTRQTWDQMEAEFEGTRWRDLDFDTRNALAVLGFRQEQWDCFVVHYADYAWPDLVKKSLHGAYQELGYDRESWMGGESPTLGDWDTLTSGQQYAAASLCFFSDTWDGLTLPEMGNIPVVYPHFRYIPWGELPQAEKSLALMAGWTDETWDEPGGTELDFEQFSSLSDNARQALMQMGFYKDQFDCWENHYEGFSWDELVDWGLTEYFEAFGWTQALYESDSEPPAWSGTSWDDLSDAQKEAAMNLCFFEEIWDGLLLPDWNQAIEFPIIRFTPWNALTDDQELLAGDIGWTRETWDIPGTADLERQIFDDLTDDQQMKLRALGFYNIDQYDCYVNHFKGLSWEELNDYQLQEYMMSLGWNAASWISSASPPIAKDKNWRDLSDDEKEAADYICYFSEIWDKEPLTVWKGIAFAETRYKPFDELDVEQQTLAQVIGWNKESWNNPGESAFERKSWDQLSATQIEYLLDFGFYEAQWNCYMTHYQDWEWFRLEIAGVAEYFETLGWTETSWAMKQPPPQWDTAWSEFTLSERIAAWELCYFEELWEGKPLDTWEDKAIQNGSSSTPPPIAAPKEKKDGNAGVVLTSVLVVLTAIGLIVFYCYRTRFAGDPTVPKSTGADISEIGAFEGQYNDEFQDSDEKEHNYTPTIT